MGNIKSRYILICFTIALSAVFVNYLDYGTYENAEAGIQAIEGIPMEFGKWHGENVLLEDRIYELLETKSIIHRKYYSEKGNETFLSIVYHPETKVNFHAPEQCLGAQGIPIEKSLDRILFKNGDKKVEINLNRLMQEQSGKKFLVYFFFKTGDFIGPNYIKLRLNLAINKFTNKKKSGSLIRISTPFSNDNSQKAAHILTDFIKELYPYLIINL